MMGINLWTPTSSSTRLYVVPLELKFLFECLHPTLFFLQSSLAAPISSLSPLFVLILLFAENVSVCVLPSPKALSELCTETISVQASQMGTSAQSALKLVVALWYQPAYLVWLVASVKKLGNDLADIPYYVKTVV